MADQSLCLPVRANWSRPVEQTFEYRTNAFVARSSRESTRRVLRPEPRLSWQFDGMVSRDPMRNLMRFLSNRLGEIGYGINPVEFVHTVGPIDIGEAVVSVDDVPYWLTGDSWCILTHDNSFELFQVLGVIDPNVTFAANAISAWPTGSRLYKAEYARMAASPKIDMATRGTGVIPIRMNVDPANTILPAVGAAGDMFDDREIFRKRPNMVDGIEVGFSFDDEVVDYDHGRIASFSPGELITRDFRATYLGRTTEEVWEVIDLFRRMYGRAGEFYAPTGIVDLKPVADLTSGTAILTTAGLADYEAYANLDVTSSRLVNKAVLVELRDDTYVAKKISTVTSVSGNSRFTMTTNWSSTIGLADIKYINYLPLCRFGSDTLTIEWLTRSVAQFNLAIHTLESLPAPA